MNIWNCPEGVGRDDIESDKGRLGFHIEHNLISLTLSRVSTGVIRLSLSRAELFASFTLFISASFTTLEDSALSGGFKCETARMGGEGGHTTKSDWIKIG